MASSVYRLLFSIVVIFIISLTGFGSALRIITEPQDYNEVTDEEVNVTCIADGPTYWAQTVMVIQLMKQDQEKPIAVINMRQDLTMGPNSQDNMKAEGHIDPDASRSFLTLTFVKPTKEDAGTYKCKMTYMDENYQTFKETVTANVTFNDPDMIGIVTHLMDKVSALVKTVQEQGDFDLKQNENIHLLEKQIIDTSTKLNKTFQNQENEHVTFKKTHDVLQQDIDDIRDKLDKQNATDMELKKQIDELKEDNKNKQQQLDILMECCLQKNETNRKLLESLDKSNKEELCLDKGWKFHPDDQTCLQVFGRNDRSKRLSWSDARAACQVLGGDLVQIRDDDKKNFVSNNFVNGTGLWTWIGVRNQATVGFDFKYADGSPVGTYHPWYPGRPEGDYEGDYKCVAMYPFSPQSLTGRWMDTTCSTKRPYVCSI